MEVHHDPHYLFGPSEWRAEHAKELENVYAESRHLRNVRVLDWLPIMHARTVPRFDVCRLAIMHKPKADTWDSMRLSICMTE